LTSCALPLGAKQDRAANVAMAIHLAPILRPVRKFIGVGLLC
jgi:hypothetical protein